MFEEIAVETGAGAWAVASLLFFIAVWLVVAVRTFRTRPQELDAQARLVFDGEPPPAAPIPGSGREA